MLVQQVTKGFALWLTQTLIYKIPEGHSAKPRPLVVIAFDTLQMKKFLFYTSLICSTLVCVFMWTRLSLNGYKTDVYFFIVTLFLNSFCFLTFYKTENISAKVILLLSLATIQLIGLSIFLCVDKLQVDKVYQPANIKYNLYSSIGGWYRRSYFKEHNGELCGDGELWQTKVPYYFPLIEIETERDNCHKVGIDSNYQWLYQHIPE